MAFQRGLNENQEQSTQSMVCDTRTLGMRVSDFFKDRIKNLHISWGLGFIHGVVSRFGRDFFSCWFNLFSYCITRKSILPFRMPMRSEVMDYNDCIPGTNKPKKAGGIYFFGNDKATQEELWFTNDDMRTHALIFGSTGSGKTEYLAVLHLTRSYNPVVSFTLMVKVITACSQNYFQWFVQWVVKTICC